MVNKTMYQKIQHFKRKGFIKADIVRGIGIIILLVLCLTLLLFTACVVNAVTPETTSGNLENQENTEKPVIVDTEESGTVYPQKWSGLTVLLCGMNKLRVL